MQSFHDLWPPTAQSFIDEFGRIDQEVYDAARQLWPRSHALIQQTVRDEAAAHSGLMKACAQVTHQRQHPSEEISNLPAYLARTWRILLDEITSHMDEWTREIFELRSLGFEFDEIAAAQKSNSHALRTRFNRKLKQLLKDLRLSRE